MMAAHKKILGQLYPSADTIGTLYATDSTHEAVVSTLFCCNQSDTDADTFAIAVRPTGESLTLEHILYSNEPIPASRTYAITCGITMGTDCTLEVRSTNGTMSFSAFGQESDA